MENLSHSGYSLRPHTQHSFSLREMSDWVTVQYRTPLPGCFCAKPPQRWLATLKTSPHWLEHQPWLLSVVTQVA